MRGAGPELQVGISIDNHDQIAAAYGVATVYRVGEVIRRRLVATPGVRCVIAANDTGHLQIEVEDLDAVCGPWNLPMTAEAVIEWILRTIGSAPIVLGEDTLLLAPSLVSVRARSGGAVPPVNAIMAGGVKTSADGLTRPCPPIVLSQAWRRTYRNDMARAVELFEAIDDDRIQFAWQPVRHAARADAVLYRECLLRITDTQGRSRSPGDFIPALERLGLMRVFDTYVVDRVMAELKAAPGVTLAANISAQSAVDDAWWCSLRAALAAAPELASRLVFEITESADLVSMPAALAFIAMARQLGCRVALDDFGAGYASLHNLIGLKPDMVKVDAACVGWAEQGGAQAQAGLAHLLRLLEMLAPIVIVEGVATSDQSAMALNAGAIWQQGYHHGRPTVANLNTRRHGTAMSACQL